MEPTLSQLKWSPRLAIWPLMFEMFLTDKYLAHWQWTNCAGILDTSHNKTQKQYYLMWAWVDFVGSVITVESKKQGRCLARWQRSQQAVQKHPTPSDATPVIAVCIQLYTFRTNQKNNRDSANETCKSCEKHANYTCSYLNRNLTPCRTSSWPSHT